MYRAYLLFKVVPGYEEEVLQKLKKNGNVEESHTIYGVYDIITKVKAETCEGLHSVIRQIKRYKGVDELSFKTLTIVTS